SAASIALPPYPAIAPYAVPIATDPSAARQPTVSEILAPYNTRDNTSLDNWSVPNQNARDGGWLFNRTMSSCWMGLCGARAGAKIAANASSVKTPMAPSTTGSRLSHFTPFTDASEGRL